jgi:hypothetical protein
VLGREPTTLTDDTHPPGRRGGDVPLTRPAVIADQIGSSVST